MIFPRLKDKTFGYVNLNLEASEWLANKKFVEDKNPLLDPVICQQMVDDVHRKYHLDFSYGGWMEDRSLLWRGSYLESKKNFIHLGIDLNVPAGTEIALGFDVEIVKVDDDYPEDGGWGPRITVRHLSQPVYLIYAHLGREIKQQVGDKVRAGEVFARVGEPPFNGNWFPHLHVQTISPEYFAELEKNNSWGQLDGYGSLNDLTINAARFKDPTQYIF